MRLLHPLDLEHPANILIAAQVKGRRPNAGHIGVKVQGVQLQPFAALGLVLWQSSTLGTIVLMLGLTPE